MPQLPEHLTVRQLHYLLLVLEHGSVEEAAQVAGVSHQAVHRSLASLNRLVGIDLYHAYGGQNPRPTYRARAFCAWLQQWVPDLPGWLDAVRRGASGRVICATTGPVIMHYGPSLVRQLLSRRPECELAFLDISHAPESGLLAVKRLDADLALMPRQSKAAGLREHELGKCHYVLVMGTDHPLAKRREIRLEDLLGHPMIAYREGSSPQKVVDGLFPNGHPRRVVEASNCDAALVYALSSRAFAIVHEATVASHADRPLRCYALECLPDDVRPPMTMCAYTRVKMGDDPLLAELCDTVRKAVPRILDDASRACRKRLTGRVVA